MNELDTLLQEQAPDAIIFADSQGIIRVWNRAAERIFGFAPQEALGHSLDLIIPERFREAHWAGFHRAIATGETKYSGQALPTRAQRKDGSTVYVELTFSVIRGGGRVAGALAHARDITERWLREREERQKLRDLEARVGGLEAENDDAPNSDD
jgi:PAS domain S-box-containing protein